MKKVTIYFVSLFAFLTFFAGTAVFVIPEYLDAKAKSYIERNIDEFLVYHLETFGGNPHFEKPETEMYIVNGHNVAVNYVESLDIEDENKFEKAFKRELILVSKTKKWLSDHPEFLLEYSGKYSSHVWNYMKKRMTEGVPEYEGSDKVVKVSEAKADVYIKSIKADIESFAKIFEELAKMPEKDFKANQSKYFSASGKTTVTYRRIWQTNAEAYIYGVLKRHGGQEMAPTFAKALRILIK